MSDCFFFFFFSSRRRHTRSLRDWSSDVCSSDLWPVHAPRSLHGRRARPPAGRDAWWRNSGRSEERREGKSVDLGGRRIIKKKKKEKETVIYNDEKDSNEHEKTYKEKN